MNGKGTDPKTSEHTSNVGFRIFLAIFSLFFLTGGVLMTFTMGKNVFETQDWLSAIFLVIPVLFAVLGASGVYVAVFHVAWRTKASASISNKASTVRGDAAILITVLGYAFFGVFFAAGIGTLVNGCLIPVARVVEVMTWTQLPCVILDGRVTKRTGEDSVSYGVSIRYRYDAGGKEITSNRLAPVDYSVKSRKDAESLLTRYPPGSERQCYVSPRDQSRSVLIAGGFQIDLLVFGLMGLVFMGVGGGGIYFVGTRVKEWRKKRDERGEKSSVQPDSVPCTAETGGRDHAIARGLKLKPKTTPLRKFLLALVVAIVWNGTIGVIAWLCWTGENGSVSWWAWGIIGLFGLVGLLIVWGLGGAFLALFAPRPELVIDCKHIRLGEPFHVSWKFSGSEQFLPALSLYVEGVEEASSGAGSDMKTDTHTFAHIPIAALSGRAPFVRGSQAVTIPANSMHTFSGDHNSIRWTIRLKADAAGAHSLDETFEIEVGPLPAEARKRA